MRGSVWGVEQTQGPQCTAPILPTGRGGRKCLVLNLPHVCRAQEILVSGLSGEDAASPAATGDPPPPLRPKPQASWTSQAQRKLST